ncbi:MAG: hypothetical protein JXR40_06405 [Pontiellaceae bacterium]|nr:hypothetical protein [Pontiellaceae bacterium]
MKHLWMLLMICLAVGTAAADVTIDQIDLTGDISEKELTLNMTFEADVSDAPARIKVLDGSVAPTRFELPKKAEMVLEDGVYYIEFEKNGEQSVSIDFEAKVFPSEQRRAAAFGLPSANVRCLTLTAETTGYQVDVANAPSLEQLDEKRVRAYLPPSDSVRIVWSPKVEKLSGELVASCDAVLVGSAKVGTLMVQGQFSYAIPQGRMKDLSLVLPAGLNITQVSGADVLSWNIVNDEEAESRRLVVELSRPHEKSYVLSVLAELSLPEFPCSFEFPVIEPQGVIRANGVVLVGTESTIKLLVDEQGGLTQVEQNAVSWKGLARPTRGLYAYMFANMPFRMKLTADNVVTSIHAQDQLVLALSENDASLEASIDLEVRDAPARDVEIEVDADWTVAAVEGQNVSDYDVRDRDGSRFVKVYFARAVDNRALLNIRLERTLAEEATGFQMPFFKVLDAKSERGFIVLRGETGTRLEGTNLKELREVNTGSLPVRISDARQAFRYKSPDWSGRVSVRQELSSIHAEAFHLVSLGESGVFGSCLITYNIANAPTRSFTLRIPEELRNVEVQGRDLRSWTQDGDEWTVQLQQKVIGDYNLLVTYDYPAKYQGEALPLGGIELLDIENETGYIALAGAANLSLEEELSMSSDVLHIDAEEVPEEYALLVNDPIMNAYRFTGAPHEASVKIKRLATHPLLTQVADHTTFETTISQEGEAITLATYHVKNTDRQYLSLRLPEGASLWSVKVDDHKTQVLERGDSEVLVPVERRRDPNAPLKVEVTYAQQMEKPGFRRRLTFQSPDVDTPAVFARWSFKLPDGQILSSAAGGMELPPELMNRQVSWGDLWDGSVPPGIWIVALGVLAFGLYFLGRNEGVSFGAVALSLISLGAALVLFVWFSSTSLTWTHGASDAPAEWAFTKAVTGGAGPLEVQLTIVSTVYLVVKIVLLFVIGLVPVVVALIARRPAWRAPALAILAAVCSFSPWVAWITVLVPLLILLTLCFAAGRRSRGLNPRNHKAERKMPPYEPEDNDVPMDVPMSGSEGSARVGVLSMIVSLVTLISLGCAMTASADDEAPEPPAMPTAQWVDLSVDVPAFGSETNVSATVHVELELDAEKKDQFLLLPPEFVMKNYELSSRRLSVEVDENGCMLQVERDGTYTISFDYLTEAVLQNGAWRALMWVPSALRNSASVSLPEAGWDIESSAAIRIRQEGPAAQILFNSRSRVCTLSWKPEVRKTEHEETRFFCDINTLADFRPGMVDLRHDISFNIAQGELQNLEFGVPSGMSITEVHGNNVATWRYDPDAGLLEVVLSPPARDSYTLNVGAQVAQEKLPYAATLEGIDVHGAAMQRGVLALAAPEAVQIDIESVDTLSGINVDDAARLLSVNVEGRVKRAFRYNQLPFSVQISADEVLPELRLEEATSLDVATEQIRLSSRLNVTVAKSGVFSLRLQIPDGFDIDSLTGEAVSHWDEVSGDMREVVVNFKNQVLGTIPLNLVLSRSGRDLESSFAMPRVRLAGALKHAGTLAVTVERGIRITSAERDGVSEIAPRELGMRQEGSLTYRLLRPDWSIQLNSEVMEPKVTADVLQSVALAEGQLKVRCFVQYEIEHAGVKIFQVQSPWPEVDLVVAGNNVSQVRKVDAEQGIWEVELHGKVEDRYEMEVACQIPVANNSSELTIRPITTIGTESQKGYVAVRSSGRLQISPVDVPDSLRPEDARSIPRRFSAGDLSDAVLCYRATESDYALKLNMVRLNAAEVLPAQVRSVRLNSLITQDGQALNNMVMNLDPGAERFLEMRLPQEAEIWSVFMNETAVRPMIEKGLYYIPIEPGADRSTTVEVMYVQAPEDESSGRNLKFAGPQFKLPLRDVVWTFYAPEGYRYSRFDGTMEHREEEQNWSFKRSFSETEYISYNAENARVSGNNAKINIIEANDYMEKGDQLNARKALQKAISYSQGQVDLNEDARVQYRNLVGQQGVAGLVNRRNQLKQSLNQQVVVQGTQGDMYQMSNAEMEQIEAQLGEKESSALRSLADRMLDQQQAAAIEVHPIRVVMATQGTKIEFDRTLQLQPDSEMVVEFVAAPAAGGRTGQGLAVLLSCGVVLLAGIPLYRLRRAAA